MCLATSRFSLTFAIYEGATGAVGATGATGGVGVTGAAGMCAVEKINIVAV